MDRQLSWHRLQELAVSLAVRKVQWQVAHRYRRRRGLRVATTAVVGTLAQARPFMCQPETVAAIAEWARRERPAAVAHVRQMADEICGGTIRLHRFAPYTFAGEAPDWQDASERTRWRLLGRHDYWLWLALAWVYTDEERYRQTLHTHLKSWLVAEVAEVRPHDKSIDGAMRQLNWAWLRQIPGLLSGLDGVWSAWVAAVRTDVARTQMLLSPGGNHLALDGIGLWAAGVSNVEIPEAKGWAAQGLAILRETAVAQFSEEGFHEERSTGYHFLMTRILLTWARSDAVVYGDDGSEGLADIWALVRAAVGVAAAMQLPDGDFPLWGDSDRFSLTDGEHVHHLVLLAAHQRWGGALVGAWDVDGVGRDLEAWYLGVPTSAKGIVAEGVTDAKRLLAWPEIGYGIVRDQPGAEGTMVMIDGGPVGMAGFHHHGHADGLSVVASLQGLPLLIDPGGYAYRDDAWRHWVRSTAAHSTIQVAGLGQTEMAGIHETGYQARVAMEQWGDEQSLWLQASCAHHRGHPHKAWHRRSVALVPWAGQHLIWVLDEIGAKPGCAWTSFWHLHPRWQAEARGDDWQLTDAAGNAVDYLWQAEGDGAWQAVKGQEEPTIQGWFIPEAQEKVPSWTLMWQGVVGEAGRAFSTAVWLPPNMTGPAPVVRLSDKHEGAVLQAEDGTVLYRLGFMAGLEVGT